MDTNQLPVLTVTEWRLLGTLWTVNKADAKTVSQLLRENFGERYSAKTTGILLARLAAKGHVRFEVDRKQPGRPVHLYSAALSRDEALRAQFSNFLTAYSIQPSDAATLQSVLDQITPSM